MEGAVSGAESGNREGSYQTESKQAIESEGEENANRP